MRVLFCKCALINLTIGNAIMLVFIAVAQSLCVPIFAQVPLQSQDTTSHATISFQALKALEGTWKGKVTTEPSNPDINGPIEVKMYVASRGNVVMHEISPGGMLEPTIIYLDSNRLTMIHYCEAGNRPRLVASASPDPNIAKFYFVDISGSKEPVYLSNFTFKIIDANKHTEDWTFTLSDGSHLHAHFDLSKTKE